MGGREGRAAQAQRPSEAALPLSSVIELESLLLGIEGKRAGWRVLRRQAQVDQRLDPAQLDDLTARADQQVETVEGLRIEAAAEAFG